MSSTVLVKTAQFTQNTAKAARQAAKAAKIFKRDLPNSFRRSLVESGKKSNYKIAPNDFHDYEAGDYFALCAEKQIEAKIAKFKYEPCTCVLDSTSCDDGWHCTCCGFDDYFSVCRRCESLNMLSDMYDYMWHEYESEIPTNIPELESAKGSVRDGTTWRRKPTTKRLSRVDLKKKNSEHRETVRCL